MKHPTFRLLATAVAMTTFLSLARAEDPPPPPPAAEDSAPAASTDGGALSNRPADFGSGYESWSTRGGATLGGHNGARAQIQGGTGWAGGYGWFNLEGQYFFSLGQDFDLGVGARLPVWPFGLAPGIDLRYRFISGGKFQLALDAGVYVPIVFAGLVTGVNFGLSLEPGVMMSYFFKDNMELYFGVVIPMGLTFVPSVFFNFAIDTRVGFTYTFKKQNIGVYGNIDIGPSFGPFGGVFATVPGFVLVGFGGSFTAGVQFRL